AGKDDAGKDDAGKDDAGKADDGKGEDEEGAAPTAPFWKASQSEGLKVRGLSCLRIHPKTRSIIWAHVHGMGPAVSADGGRTWTPRLDGVGEKERPGLRSQVRITLDPADAKTVYLTIDGQIYSSGDGGRRWSSITSGALASLSWDQFKSTHLSWEVIVDPKKSVHLLVGTRNDGDHNGGLYESSNGGKSWAEIAGSAQSDTGLGNDTFLVRLNPSSDKYVTVAGRTGVWYSDSRGRKFSRNDPGGLGIHDVRGMSAFAAKELYLADARGIWRSKDGGKRWDKKVLRAGDALDVYVDPHNRKRLFAIFAERGVEVSEDGRKSKWKPYGGSYGAGADGEDAPAPNGYRDAMIREVYVHPRDRKVIYMASPITGLHVSNDGGKTFTLVEAPEDAKPEVRMPLHVPPMALVATHTAEGGSALAVSASGQVFRRAAGATWGSLGPLGMLARGLQPDGANGHWLALGYRLRRSRDDGATWTTIWPSAKPPKGLSPEERVAGAHRGPAGQDKDGKPVPGVLTLLLERSGALMRSTDDGATWKEIRGPKFPSSETWAAAFAVNSGNPDHMVIAARTTREAWNSRDENGGLYQTWDGGKSWQDFTGVLKPGKKDDGEARKAKAFWNRARFVSIDPVAGLIVYGADRRGVFTHPIIDPKGKEKVKTVPQWFDVTPKSLAAADITAMTRTLTDDKTSSRYVAQLLGANDQGAVVSISGATLKSLHAGLAAALAAKASDAEVRGNFAWDTMASPRAGVRFTSITVDPIAPNRFLASEEAGPGGIHMHVDPTVKKVEPKKDDAPGKVEEPKKEAAAKPKLSPPEGMRAFTAGHDKTWRVWGVDTGASTGQMIGHENVVWCVGLAPDETQIVTGGEDRTIRFWDARSAKHLGTVTIDGTARGLAFDDDSKYVYVAGGPSNKLHRITMADRAAKAFEGHKGAVLSVACSEDTSRVYSGGEDQMVVGWDTEKGTQVLSIAVGSPVIALAVAADGSRFYAAGKDKTIAAFDAAGKPVGRLEGLVTAAHALALAPEDGTLYATTTDGVLAVDAATMKVRTTHAAPAGGELSCVTVSSDGVWILAGDMGGGLWIWQQGNPEAYRARVQEHEGAVHGVAITPEETEASAPGAAPAKDGAPKEEAPKEEAPKDGAPKPAPAKDAPAKDAPEK
ncbi:MAG: hypothetical protein P1V36_12765, partial [Planctomycetota bacterium]|nr:hypothetical protein [Planctomycetota bacterium]